MIVTEAKFVVRLISPDALAQYMKHRDHTVRSLALACGGEHLRSTIGHLRSGRRRACQPDLARRIERALDAPRGSLFVPSVSRVSREVAPIARAS